MTGEKNATAADAKDDHEAYGSKAQEVQATAKAVDPATRGTPAVDQRFTVEEVQQIRNLIQLVDDVMTNGHRAFLLNTGPVLAVLNSKLPPGAASPPK
jgi:hypothetical protein